MAFCSNCGNEIREGVKFCPVCGKEILSGVSIADSDSNKHTRINLAEIVRSEPVKDVQEKAKLTGNWYVLNWKRLGDGNWKEEGLKHHLAWIGIHLGVILIVFLLIGAIRPRDIKGDREYGLKTDNSYDDISDNDVDKETDSKDKGETIKEIGDSAKENIDYYKKILFKDLTGTWTNSLETFAITIGKDGTVKISDSTGTFGADAFTYTEVDDDTVRLKVESDNALVGMLSIDMDYEVNGETLTISALGQTYDLTRRK